MSVLWEMTTLADVTRWYSGGAPDQNSLGLVERRSFFLVTQWLLRYFVRS